MKKRSVVLNEKDLYNIKTLINNTAYIVLPNGETGLLNIRTNQLLGNIDNFKTCYTLKDEIYEQIKTVEATDERGSYRVINLYDALEEKWIAEGWGIVSDFLSNYQLCSLKSPSDGKIHFFDLATYRDHKDIFDIACYDVRVLYNYDNTWCFMINCGAEKGLYLRNGADMGFSMVSCDIIGSLPNIFVFTKDGKCDFIYNTVDDIKEITDKSIISKKDYRYDNITVDENNNYIIYCQNENGVDVYHTKRRALLCHYDGDDIKYFGGNEHYSFRMDKDFYFLTSNNSKFGLVRASTFVIQNNDDYMVKTTSLLEEKYDDIKTEPGAFSFSKDGKVGFLKINPKPEMNHFIEAKYDKIKELGNGYYALYNDGYCDIVLFKNGKVSTVVKKCQLEDIVDDSVIYKKDKKKGIKNKLSKSKDKRYGLLFIGSFEPVCYDKYDNISRISNRYHDYFVMEKKGKKGVVCDGKLIIPVKAKDISIGYDPDCCRRTYFALKNNFNQYKLLSGRYSGDGVEFDPTINKTFKDVSFLNDIMVLKDSLNTYIYSYFMSSFERDKLKTLSGDVDVVAKKVPNQFRASVGDKEFPSSHSNFLTLSDYIYCINGTNYFYTDGVFCEICKDGIISSNKDCYMTTYEADDCIYQIKTTDKSEHDSFCEYIDNQDDEVADIYLDNMSRDSEALHEQYPTLVLKKVKKNN